MFGDMVVPIEPKFCSNFLTLNYSWEPEDIIWPHLAVWYVGEVEPERGHLFGFYRLTFPFIANIDMTMYDCGYSVMLFMEVQIGYLC